MHPTASLPLLPGASPSNPRTHDARRATNPLLGCADLALATIAGGSEGPVTGNRAIRKNKHTTPNKERKGDRGAGQPLNIKYPIASTSGRRYVSATQLDGTALGGEHRQDHRQRLRPNLAQYCPGAAARRSAQVRSVVPGPDFCSMKFQPAGVRLPVAETPLEYPSLTHCSLLTRRIRP